MTLLASMCRQSSIYMLLVCLFPFIFLGLVTHSSRHWLRTSNLAAFCMSQSYPDLVRGAYAPELLTCTILRAAAAHSSALNSIDLGHHVRELQLRLLERLRRSSSDLLRCWPRATNTDIDVGVLLVIHSAAYDLLHSTAISKIEVKAD